ncbi:MAG: glycosyltransferase [Casimicrobiaceae bacterium]
MHPPAISVIICSIDERKFAAVSSNYRALLANTPHEIIGIHDARSLAEGYNRGVREAQGELLIFSHDDIEIVSVDFCGALRRAAEVLDVFGVIGTSKLVWAFWPAAGHPHLHGWIAHPTAEGNGCEVSVYGVDGPVTTGLQALDGVFFAAKREVVERVPFDEATFDGFHGYDVDFTFATHLAGFRVGTTAEIALVHASSGHFGPEWERYAVKLDVKYAERLTGNHEIGNWASVRRVLASRHAIARECTLERLMAVTRHLRAQVPRDE